MGNGLRWPWQGAYPDGGGATRRHPGGDTSACTEFFTRTGKSGPGESGGLSTLEASAMIGVHRIGGGRKPSRFRPQTRGLRALGDYSGGHVLAKVLSSAVLGIDAYRVEVEVDISSGLPSFATVGLPEASVKESRERVKSAITNSGYRFPDDRITVNLAPADIKKEGTGFDLPIALGILAATGVVPQEMVSRYLVLGELSLDGRVKPVRGSLPMALSARQAGHLAIIVPHDNGREASVISDIDVLPVKTLSQVVGFLRGQTAIAPEKADVHAMFNRESAFDVDYAEVCGQEHAKRALEIAAAGGHNLITL